MQTLAGKRDPVFGPNHLAVAHLVYEGGHNDFIAGRLTPGINDILYYNQ